MREICIVFFALLAGLAAFSGACADYNPLMLIQQLVRADIVVSGRVVRFDGMSYEFEVERAIRPDILPQTLTVRQIENPDRTGLRGGVRITGETRVLFAKRGSGTGAPLIPLGEAGEGEMPRDDPDGFGP